MKHLYYVKLTNLTTGLIGYKIGTTVKPISHRFHGSRTMGILVEPIFYEPMDNAEHIEQAIIQTYSNYLLGNSAKELIYSKNSGGYTEVFALDLRNVSSTFFTDNYLTYQTSTKAAIQAYRAYKEDHKGVTMAEFAESCGASLANIGRVIKIGGNKRTQFNRHDIISLLESGGKFQIPNGLLTDSLTAIESFLRKMQLNRKAKLTGMAFDTDTLSESEQDMVDAAVLKFADESVRVRKALAKRLYSSIPRELEEPTE